jgi:sortase A
MKSRLLIFIGCILLVTALAFTAYNIYDDARASESSDSAVRQLLSEIPSKRADEITDENLPAYILNPEMEMPVKTINGIDYIGTIEIPELNIVLPVISELTNSALKLAPCRYEGSLYTNNLIIGGHNYRAHFSQLRHLPVGSDVIFTDAEGNVFRFRSTVTETLMPTDVEEIKSGDWDLTLFTCTFGGQYRVTVRCEKV